MKQIDYENLYGAIFDNIPEYQIDRKEVSSGWVCADTTFGCGIALRNRDFDETSLKLACANSYYNRGDNNYLPFDRHYSDCIDFQNKTVGIVGNMNGIVKRYCDVCKKIYVFDLESKECLPPEKEDEILPECDIAVITGSTIQNGTLPHVLSLCENAYTVLTGPSVPQCEELLNFGIDMIAGMCVSDREMMFDFVMNDTHGSPYRFGMPFRIVKD